MATETLRDGEEFELFWVL